MRQLSIRDLYRGRFTRPMLVTVLLVLSFSYRATAEVTSTTSTPFPYQLVGIAKFGHMSYASIIDLHTGYHFLLSKGTRSGLGLILASVQTDSEPSGPSATIQENGVSITLALGSTASVDPATAAPSAPSATILTEPAVTPTPRLQTNYPKPPPGATLPLVFQEVDPQKMTLTADQKATLDQLRHDFINDLNGARPANSSANDATSPTAASPASANQNSANSNTPYQNWLAAQNKSDATFRMLFGTQAFNAYTESSSYPTAP